MLSGRRRDKPTGASRSWNAKSGGNKWPSLLSKKPCGACRNNIYSIIQELMSQRGNPPIQSKGEPRRLLPAPAPNQEETELRDRLQQLTLRHRRASLVISE